MTNPAEHTSDNKKIGKSAGVVSFFTLISRVLGLVRDMMLARFFGTGIAMDAFIIAFSIPNMLRRLFAEGALTIAFIPIFTEYLHRKSREDAFHLARVVLTLLSLILVVVTILGILFAPWIVRIQAFGFGGAGIKYDLTVFLTRITFPYIFFISLVAFFMGVLNSLKHFASPAAAPILLNVGIIGAILLISPHFSEPITGVAIGVLIGGILQVGLQIPMIIKKGISLFPCWMPHHPAVTRLGKLMLPAIFGSATYQFNYIISRLLASFLVVGSISGLFFADRLVQFPLGVFAIAVSTAALPTLSRQVTENNLRKFVDTLSHSLRMVFFIIIPSMAGLIVLGDLMIQVFFQRGAFNAESSAMTYQALVFFSLGLWAFSGIKIMVSAFYALQDTRTPVKVAVVNVLANLLFSLILMGPLKHGGLAMAVSMASILQFILLIFFLKKRISDWDLKPILNSVIKCVVASVIMGTCVYFIHLNWWDAHSVWYLAVKLFVLVFAGIIIYFISARILGCSELGAVKDIFRPLLGKLSNRLQ